MTALSATRPESRTGLVERQPDRVWLDEVVTEAIDGRGSLVLLAGEAGVGKTRLAEEAASSAEVRFLRGSADPGAPAHGPVTAALRAFLRTVPDGLAGVAPLGTHLALLLPELGDAAAESDQATLFEAVHAALAALVIAEPAVILLDDLHECDEATLELLAVLAAPLRELSLLVIGAYRSEEISGAHPLRRLRHYLRRSRLLQERTLDPLSEAGTGELAENVLGAVPSDELTRRLHERTGGIPFFVEELSAALLAGGRLDIVAGVLELEDDAEVRLPETIRDAVLLQTAGLSGRARATAEVAAVAGPRFDIELVAALGSDAGLEEVVEAGLITELDLEPGRAAFRHPLARDAIYNDVPWLRGRSLHRRLAENLEAADRAPTEVAGHWLAAHDGPRALDSLIRAIGELAAVHAYRDAARVGRQALELWPEGERGAERIAVLERHARFAELSGEMGDAVRPQREVVTARRSQGEGRALADAERRLAFTYELQGDRERATGARRVAADAYAANGLPGEAATERLIVAGYLRDAGSYGEAAQLADRSYAEAERAERADLRARALGLRGIARVQGGTFDAGRRDIHAGLSLALQHELNLEAAEVYQRLGTALEIAADYRGARDALSAAVGLCRANDADGQGDACLSCMAYVLRELGNWDASLELCRELSRPGADPVVQLVADGVLGSILAFRGDLSGARPLLLQSHQAALAAGVMSMSVDTTAALAWLEERDGRLGEARSHCRFLLDRWEHSAVWCLRWAAAFFVRHGPLRDARACAQALATIATRAGHADALAALAHALGEIALCEGHVRTAVEQLGRATSLHEGLEIPFERAQMHLRLGVALAAAGQRDQALERFTAAYTGARALGAAPLAAEAATEVDRLGESVERSLGRRAAADHQHAGLSRRELEVVRRVALGFTNREIAAELVLSPRTVDMHVRHILEKLRCRSRTEAATRAGQLGLLPQVAVA